MMTKPLIGITMFRVQQGNFPRAALNQAYINAVQKAGGIPVLIPVGIPEGQFEELFARIDGVLLTGGVDIVPAHYRAPMHPQVTEVDPLRDEMEIALVPWLVKSQKPFFGICRGIEVINVALGGTLYTHISDQLPNALHHPCYPDLPRNLLAHTVSVEASSRLADILGNPQVWVNSLHHQGVKDLAPGLRATAFAPDGLVEGLEINDHPFGLAVQWHPEELIDQLHMLNLFQALVQASLHA
jgi:putative glutamine amidotransferase